MDLFSVVPNSSPLPCCAEKWPTGQPPTSWIFAICGYLFTVFPVSTSSSSLSFQCLPGVPAIFDVSSLFVTPRVSYVLNGPGSLPSGSRGEGTAGRKVAYGKWEALPRPLAFNRLC